MKYYFGKFLSRKFISNPIFILGDGRSGTSVLLQALGRHPEILSIPGESPLITSIGGMIGLFEYDSERRMHYYEQSLPFSKDIFYEELKRFCFETVAGSNYGFQLLLKHLILLKGEFFKKKYWSAKTFPPEKVALSLLKLYPDASYICIIRNGIDVVQSKTKFSGFKGNDFRSHCDAWKNSIDKYTFVSSLKRGVIVRHEHLINYTDSVFKEVFSAIGVKYDNCSSRFVNSNLIHPLDKSSQSGIDAREILKNRPPAYETWTIDQQSIFKEICGIAMEKAGYSIPF